MDIAGSVSSKPTLRENPGTRYSDLYYDASSSKVQIIEASSTYGKFSQQYPVASYGSNLVLQFPNTNYVGTTILNARIPVPDKTLYAGATLCKGWLLRLLRRLELTVGNSNMGIQPLEGVSMFHSLLAAAESTEQLDFDLNCAGEFTNGVKTSYGSIVVDGGLPYYTAEIILDLPFSNYVQGEKSKLYFDTSLLNAPILVNLVIGDFVDVWGTTLSPTLMGLVMPQFSITYREMTLTNRNNSIRNELYAAPGASVNYPSFYRQTFTTTTTVPAPTLGGPPGGAFRHIGPISLSGFLNADIYSMILTVHRPEDLRPTAPFKASNPWNALPVANISLKFGGDEIFKSVSYSNRLIQQMSNVASVKLLNVYSVAGASAMLPGAAGINEIYPIIIDMSRLRAFIEGGSFPNTIRIPQQTLTIEFDIPDYFYAPGVGGPGDTVGAVSIDAGRLDIHCTSFYPMITAVNSTGSVNIFYN